jgi:hypothetical protein
MLATMHKIEHTRILLKCTGIQIYVRLKTKLQGAEGNTVISIYGSTAFFGPWPLFQFLDQLHNQ